MKSKPYVAAMLGLALMAAGLVAGPSAPADKEKKPMVKKLTPVLFVAEIEPCLKFWEGLGFQKTMEVPEGNKLGFIILQKGTIELMYQSFGSVEKDMPAILETVRKGPTFLYVEVDTLDSIRGAVKHAPVYMTERTTFYGSKEIGVKDPAGHYVTFAEFTAQH